MVTYLTLFNNLPGATHQIPFPKTKDKFEELFALFDGTLRKEDSKPKYTSFNKLLKADDMSELTLPLIELISNMLEEKSDDFNKCKCFYFPPLFAELSLLRGVNARGRSTQGRFTEVGQSKYLLRPEDRYHEPTEY